MAPYGQKQYEHTFASRFGSSKNPSGNTSDIFLLCDDSGLTSSEFDTSGGESKKSETLHLFLHSK